MAAVKRSGEHREHQKEYGERRRKMQQARLNYGKTQSPDNDGLSGKQMDRAATQISLKQTSVRDLV